MSTQVRWQVRWSARRHVSAGVFATALLIAFVPAMLRAQSLRIRTELDTALVSVGGRMVFTVWVEHDPAASVVWPDSLDLGSVEVIGAEILRPAREGARSVSGARFTLAAFELGDLEIPSFDVRVEAPDGSSTTLSTNPYLITVQSVGLDEGGDIRAIRGPLGIPLSVIYVLPWILLVALLGGLGYWLWVKNRPEEAGPRRSVVIPRFPHEDAYAALDRLRASDLVERGEIKEYHILVSEIIRTYVEGRYGVYALEMTTGEVVEGLRDTGVPQDAVQAFGWFGSRCDLVKFAKLRPGPDACRDSLEAARAFVDQTRPPPDPLDDGVGSVGEAGFEGPDVAGDPEVFDVDPVEDTRDIPAAAVQDTAVVQDTAAVQDTEDDEALAPTRTPAHTEGG